MMNINQILETLKYGSEEDKFEAITIVRNREPDKNILIYRWDEVRLKKFLEELTTSRPFTLDELENVKSPLFEFISNNNGFWLNWYAAITLVDLKILDENLFVIIALEGNKVIKDIYDELGPKYDVAQNQVQNYTLHAVSQFKESKKAGEYIKKCYDGKIFCPSDQDFDFYTVNRCEKAMYAFSALGNPKYRGLVEYCSVNYNDDSLSPEESKQVKEAAKIALELWGQKNYLEIVEYAEKMNPSKESTKKGFLSKFFH